LIPLDPLVDIIKVLNILDGAFDSYIIHLLELDIIVLDLQEQFLLLIRLQIR